MPERPPKANHISRIIDMKDPDVPHRVNTWLVHRSKAGMESRLIRPHFENVENVLNCVQEEDYKSPGATGFVQKLTPLDGEGGCATLWRSVIG